MGAPAWVADMLGLWAAQDRSGAELALPPISRPWAQLLGEPAQTADTDGYSPAELEALDQALEWLREAHPAHYQAINLIARPYLCTGSRPPARITREAVEILAVQIDERMR
jgi:hypothetical protein